MIILPRQARDKHTLKTPKKTVFFAASEGGPRGTDGVESTDAQWCEETKSGFGSPMLAHAATNAGRSASPAVAGPPTFRLGSTAFTASAEALYSCM
jgi:hypothetical protein